MLNFSGLTNTLSGSGGGDNRHSRRRRAGIEVLGAFNAASQMALLYPPGIDELMRHDIERQRARERRGGGLH